MSTIVLYGNSLTLRTIGAALQDCPGVRVARVAARPDDAAGWLAALEPVAVVFDRLITRPDFAIPLLDRHPEVLFVGVDPSGDRLLVLSGRENQPESAAELLELIGGEAPASRRSARADSSSPASLPPR
jgi:hypothetical protein